jgi:predicted ATPase/DNA-binding winged helix-turn-helix (wHTH) protein
MTSLPASAIRFGRITVLPSQRRVLLDGHSAPLGGRAFDLLQVLLARRGVIVTKKELLQTVWPGVVVEENNLQVQVCALRKLLGRHAIVTVPGRGYSFDGGIELTESTLPVPIAVRHGGHAALSPLRGRDGECMALAGLLRDQRIVTVVGPGGVGKSRLVREVLADAPGPVARAELALLAGGASVASCVARALDLTFARLPTAQEVADALAQESAVIVLESAERVVEAAAELVEALLDAAPGVRMICTSQAPLKAHGERVLRIAPLALPASDDMADAMESPALKLLLDAVSASQPRSAFTREELHDAIAICTHVDGLPLAIELAGARVPLLGMTGVRRLLADRFRLLTASSRRTVARHRTLLANIDWSWALLTPRERAALIAVTQFQGRFTLGMARHALEGMVANEWDAMELLGALVDKSMVLAETGSRSAFRLLENTRVYAQRRGFRPALRRPASG